MLYGGFLKLFSISKMDITDGKIFWCNEWWAESARFMVELAASSMISIGLDNSFDMHNSAGV